MLTLRCALSLTAAIGPSWVVKDSRASQLVAMNGLLLFLEEDRPNSALWAKTSLQEISICSAFYQRRWRAASLQQMLPSNWAALEACHNPLRGLPLREWRSLPSLVVWLYFHDNILIIFLGWLLLACAGCPGW